MADLPSSRSSMALEHAIQRAERAERERDRAVETRENANAVSIRVEAENGRLLNIINVAAEYLRDPERDPAEGRALAALALDKAGEASDDRSHPSRFKSAAEALAHTLTPDFKRRFREAQRDVIRADERRRIVDALRHHGHTGEGTALYEAADFIERRLS